MGSPFYSGTFIAPNYDEQKLRRYLFKDWGRGRKNDRRPIEIRGVSIANYVRSRGQILIGRNVFNYTQTRLTCLTSSIKKNEMEREFDRFFRFF